MAKRKSKKLRYIVGAVILAIIALAVFMPRKPHLTQVTSDKVKIRDITSQVTASGTIEPKVEVAISSEVSGEVVELPVNDGDRVKKGQLLARIDTELLELRVKQQEASILSAQASAEQMKVQMERAEQVLEDQERLFANKFVSEDSVREARAEALAKKAAYMAAMANISQQEMEFDQAKKNLSKAIIYSPMDGIVSSRSVELGERVAGTGDYQGTEIMTVADFAIMELVIDVNESDVVNVSVGDKAAILIDAISDTPFSGEVVEIASSAMNSDSNDDAVTFEVKVRISEADERIRPGMTATADIDTGYAEGVLTVPLQSVTVRDKQTVAKALKKAEIPEAPPQVGNEQSTRVDKKRSRAELDNLQRVIFIVKDGKVELREVKTGISDSRYMEIKEGVKEGEEVVSGSYNAIARELNHDMQVQVQPKDEGNNGNSGQK
ncbi:MAG: efflux RND transporter periplasmic adaptor subunit [Opitutales bacterium]|nr:efflux RND transporter periplasmic adaptor subunit [Opitutales bacterium]